MALELLQTVKLLQTVNIQEGLRELVDSAYSMKQNLEAKVEKPVLNDETNLWKTWLDSKTMCLYGGVNQDNRHRFKIEHAFDLAAKIINAPINTDGSISIDEATYMQSKGTEFIIISKSDLKEATADYADYAIETNGYEIIRDQLNNSELTPEKLEQTGGFEINTWLKPEEIERHKGWQELVVGKNNAPEQDYEKAHQFLKDKYVPKAEENGCFPNGTTGMGFIVITNESGYKVRPWFVEDSLFRSDALVRNYFGNPGHFLGVGAEGAAQNLTPANIIRYLKTTPVTDTRFAAVLLKAANTFYRSQQKQ